MIQECQNFRPIINKKSSQMNKLKILHQMSQEKSQQQEDITLDSNDRGSALKYDRFNDLYCQAKK